MIICQSFSAGFSQKKEKDSLSPSRWRGILFILDLTVCMGTINIGVILVTHDLHVLICCSSRDNWRLIVGITHKEICVYNYLGWRV